MEDDESDGDMTAQLFNIVLENRIFKNIFYGYLLVNSIIVLLLVSILIVHLKNIRI